MNVTKQHYKVIICTCNDENDTHCIVAWIQITSFFEESTMFECTIY